MKKLLISVLSVFLALSLTACGNSQTKLLMDDGDWLNVTEGEMTSGTYYIYKDNEKYYNFLNVAAADDATGSKYVWFTEPYDEAIPHMTIKDKLLYYDEAKRPESITLYKLTDYGYTLGIKFNVKNDSGDAKYPQVINFSDTFNTLSPVASVIENSVPDSGATVYITEINNHDFTSNLLVNDSFLKGLTKDTMYAIGMYVGTVHKSVNVKADTHLFIQEATYTASSYQELKSKTFEIYLPANLTPGYYYADGIGMFYYEGTIENIDEEDIEKILEEEGNEPTESTDSGETFVPQESSEKSDNSSDESIDDSSMEPIYGDDLIDNPDASDDSGEPSSNEDDNGGQPDDSIDTSDTPNNPDDASSPEE